VFTGRLVLVCRVDKKPISPEEVQAAKLTRFKD
jgi:hypothetical protein